MRKADFTNYLNNDDLDVSLENLNEILSSFPYFTSAHILKSKALKSIDSIDLDKQIRYVAAYSGDRKQLQSQLLNVTTNEAIEAESHTELKSDDVIVKEELDEVVVNEDNDILEKQILVEAINSSILLEVPDELDSSVELDAEKIAEVEVSEELIEPKSTFNDTESHSFSSWLNHFSDQKEDAPKELNEGLARISSTANSIQKKAEFYSASKMAKLSVQEDNDLVTETLANVYIHQENYQKAISAFEKLQLKFPEKKIYFAGRIKEVQLLTKS